MFTQMELATEIAAQFKLGINSTHGLSHWKKVRDTAINLAIWAPSNSNFTAEMIGLFAFIHDSKRENDEEDPEHGLRAAKYARELHKKGLLGLLDDQLERLCFACEYHSNSRAKSDDMFTKICWDADKLDLWRVGITPDEKYLHTDMAKEVLEQLTTGRIKIKK